MKLPSKLQDKMKALLPDSEYKEFLESYEARPYSGIRRNSLKISPTKFEALVYKGEPIPWCPEGCYYEEDKNNRLTTDPLYHCGLFYIQEPSAMYPGSHFKVQSNEFVLDLCAAPGGKTTQLAAQMENKGCLVANEINPKRARGLLKNIQLMGIKNTIITTATPEYLAEFYGSVFDKVLVDAPCSGEGMFRKDKGLLKSYEKFGPEMMVPLQQSIIVAADQLLKPGGELFYSTCTFSPEEDEGILDYLMKTTDNYEVLSLEGGYGIGDGHPEWVESAYPLEGTKRFWPHLAKGEGHFAAHLKKGFKESPLVGKDKLRGHWKPIEALPEAVKEFLNETFLRPLEGYFYEHKETYYYHEVPCLFPEKIHKETIGLELGVLNKYQFTPSQSLPMAFPLDYFKHTISLDKEGANRYLKGETLALRETKGYYVLSYEGFPLGWAKVAPDYFKNQYPKGWRKKLLGVI